MTDKEIVKALECCTKSMHKGCRNCPLFVVNGCVRTMSENALYLIKEQQEEIELLRGMDKANTDAIHTLAEKSKSVRIDSIKEFAERLKEVNNNLGDLVKEMLGDKE